MDIGGGIHCCPVTGHLRGGDGTLARNACRLDQRAERTPGVGRSDDFGGHCGNRNAACRRFGGKDGLRRACGQEIIRRVGAVLGPATPEMDLPPDMAAPSFTR